MDAGWAVIVHMSYIHHPCSNLVSEAHLVLELLSLRTLATPNPHKETRELVDQFLIWLNYSIQYLPFVPSFTLSPGITELGQIHFQKLSVWWKRWEWTYTTRKQDRKCLCPQKKINTVPWEFREGTVMDFA